MWTDSSLATPCPGLSTRPHLDRERLVSEKGLASHGLAVDPGVTQERVGTTKARPWQSLWALSRQVLFKHTYLISSVSWNVSIYVSVNFRSWSSLWKKFLELVLVGQEKGFHSPSLRAFGEGGGGMRERDRKWTDPGSGL